MNDDERQWRHERLVRTAHHKASHFTGGWLMGRPPDLVSIRPGQAFSRIVHGGGYELDGFALTRFIQTQRPEHRVAFSLACTGA